MSNSINDREYNVLPTYKEVKSVMRLLGKNQTDLRRENIGNILRLICHNDGLSRTDLASMLGLSKMGISKIVNELIENTILTENKINNRARNSQGGPVPIMLSIAPERLFSVGISITLESIECALADLALGIVYSIKKDIFGVKEESLILDLIAELMDCISTRPELHDASILGIGISVAGLVDHGQTYVDDRPEHLGKFKENLCSFITENYQLPAFMMNNMNASALAEYYFGHVRGTLNFLYLGVGDGVGAGIIHRGQLITGEHGFGGELGHTTIKNLGKKCHCGNHDCAELYVSSTALLESTGYPTWHEFIIALKDHPGEFTDKLDSYRQSLEDLLVNTINSYDPSCVVLGGHAATLSDEFFQTLNEDVNQRIVLRHYSNVPIVKSKFGIDASIVGAYSQIFHAFFNGQLQAK